MRIKSLLVASAVAAVVANSSAATFTWEPSITSPSPYFDVTSDYSATHVSVYCYGVDGVALTDVMPYWEDEDENQIKAVSAAADEWGDPGFNYVFNFSDFKSNGEYILVFPEGMLKNAAGELSSKIRTAYTFDIPELAPGMFEDFKILSISPDFSEPQAIWNDQPVTINTNHNDAIGLVKLTITDQTTGEIITTSSNYTTGREMGDTSAITWEVAGNFKFFQEHDYLAEFVFFNGTDEYGNYGVVTKIVDRVSYDFTGKVEGYKYSTVKLESVTPAPFSLISRPEQAVFTYTFSAPVNVYKAETPLGSAGTESYPSSCLSSNDDKTVWTLDLSENSFVLKQNASIIVNIYARDIDGSTVKGNEGEEANSCFQYEWKCELGAVPLVMVSPEPGAVIEKLTEVTVKSSNGEPMSWSFNGVATIQGRDRSISGMLWVDEEDVADAEESDTFTFTKWIPNGEWDPVPLDIETEGFYSIIIEHACFNFGEQYDTNVNHSLSSSFEISSSGEDPEPGDDKTTFNFISADPADGSTVESLKQIKLMYPDEVGLLGYYASIYKKGEDGEFTENVGRADVAFDDEIWELIVITPEEEITEAGTYAISVPAYTICTVDFAESSGMAGACNPAFTLTYTVAPTGLAVAEVATVSAADVFDMQGRLVLRNASADALKSLSKGIYVVDGKKVVVK